MSGTQQSFRAQQRREDLRRSLYRNGATEDDLRPLTPGSIQDIGGG